MTTLIEAMINQELGEPFRRDAMKKPVAVAGIDPADMRPQTGVTCSGGGQANAFPNGNLPSKAFRKGWRA